MTNPPTVLYLTHTLPAVVGHGGTHRAFQLQHDLQCAVGEAQFRLISSQMWWRTRRESPHGLSGGVPWYRSKLRGIARRWARCSENPLKLLTREGYSSTFRFATSGSLEPEFLQHYADVVNTSRGEAVCIIEHPMFGPVVGFNERRGIPTISAFQNLEALDVRRFEWHDRKHIYTVMTDLGNELRVLGRCLDRLVISKVEAGFIGGLGLRCEYYPYVPVGLIRDRFRATRRRRSQENIEAGLFVVLGTADHSGTCEALEWFVTSASHAGLPPGVRVVVAGLGTERLLPPGRSAAGLELRGWVPQEELETLLAHATGVVIPQWSGFGALTRLPELACAGIPVITFNHPTYALSPTPGLRLVAADWTEVCAAMCDMPSRPVEVPETAYKRWEKEQPRPLARVLHRSVGTA